jgi:hypothetical protein
MKALLLAASIVAMLCTALVTLMAIVFCLGMGANATPAEIRALKFWMAGLSLLGAAGIAGGILLLRAGQPGWAAGVSLLPAVIMGVILIVAVNK